MFKRLIHFIKTLMDSSGYIKWLFQYSIPYLPSLSLMMALSLAGSGITVFSAVITQRLIDNATAGQIVRNNIIIYVVIILVMQAMSSASSIFSVIIFEKYSFGVRKQVFEKILHSCYHQVSGYHSGDLMTRLTSDTNNVADGIANLIPEIITLIFELFMTFAVLMFYDPVLAVLALMIAPISGVISFWLSRKLKYLQVKVQESESRYRSFIQESISNVLIIKAFSIEDSSGERLQELRNDRLGWIMKRSKVSVTASTTMSLGFQGGYLLAMVWGAKKLSTQSITFGTMSVFLTLVNRIQAPVLGLSYTVPKVIKVLASAGRIIEIQNLKPEKSLEDEFKAEAVGVLIEDLSFGYTKNYLFENANVKINPGDFAAIIGTSGIGKTTLIKLILSLMDRYEGSISFFNEEGKRVETNSRVREFIAYVPQGNTLFSGTIAENLRIGKEDATGDEMAEALNLASALDFVNELPEGVDTYIGERGFGLSEGQAQRIAIARAIIKKAPFLILDESTSALDEQTELEVLEGIKNSRYKPTCLLITHRRTVLQYCNREITIKNHGIVESIK